MSLELLGIVLTASLTGIIAIYIIWDHIIDDRLLTKKVQKFYNNIENLIFYYYLLKRMDHISKAGPISYRQGLLSPGAGTHSPLHKMHTSFSNEYSYYQAKVRNEFLIPSKHSDLLSKDKKFVDLPKYLDLIFLEGDKENKIQYMNKTFFILYENGKLKKRLGEDVIEDPSKVNDYLKSLRDFWKKNHHIPFIKPKLKPGLSVPEYLNSPLLFLKKEFPYKNKEDHFEIGNLLTYLREFNDAISKFKTALNKDKNYKEAWNSKGVALFYQGALNNKGEYDEAIECYDKALEIDPYYKEALNNKGWVLVAQMKYKDALKDLEKVLKLDPNDILALSNKGWVLVAQEKYKDALKCLEKALEIDEYYILALNNKGYALNGLERYDEALECCDKVLEIDPNDIFALNSKGIALDGLKIYDKAIECLEQALKIDPNYIFALNIKGIALDGQKRYEETLECLDKALEIDPNDIFVLIIKGIALKGRKSYDKALECLDKALEIDPNNAIAWYNKARLELLRNNLEESIKSLKNAIECDKSLFKKAIEEHEFDKIKDTPEFRKSIWD